MITSVTKNPQPEAFVFRETEVLNNPRFLECLIRAVFAQGADTFGGESEGEIFVEFRYENAALDEIDCPSDAAGRVELRRTHAVAVLTARC